MLICNERMHVHTEIIRGSRLVPSGVATTELVLHTVFTPDARHDVTQALGWVGPCLGRWDAAFEPDALPPSPQGPHLR